jgi:Sec-independent protein secretion pathway component TatC
MFMFVPLLVFYELGILVAWIFGKKRDKVSESEADTTV